MRIGIIVLALATAIIHVVLAIPETIVPFFLNALGYLDEAIGLALIALLWLDGRRLVAQRTVS
ncbi:MAG: hypothetical protein H0V51_06035 [Chloroflexi bacterium]|nr:hypothetical protein [Chloroflexota bacterium]